MARSYHNIEKSGFRKGEYVGYCDGAWNIWANQDGWAVRHQQTRAQFWRKTLAEVSAELDERATNGRGAKLIPVVL